MHWVPQNKVAFLLSSIALYFLSLYGNEALIIGIASPVSIASLTMQLP